MEVHPFLLDSVADLQRSIEQAAEQLDIVSDILENCPPAVHAPAEPGTVQPTPEEEIARTVREQVWPLSPDPPATEKPRGPENVFVGSLNEWPNVGDTIQGFKTTLRRMATELIGASVSNKWVDAVVSWLISGVPPESELGGLAAKSLANYEEAEAVRNRVTSTIEAGMDPQKPRDPEPPAPQKPAEPRLSG
jgi:hypothetical protein